MGQPSSNSKSPSSSPLSDEAVRRILETTAEEIESPDPGLYEFIEKRIETEAHFRPEDEKVSDSGGFRWAAALAGLRAFCLQPRIAWGVVALQAMIILIFILSPQTRMPTVGNSYNTLSMATNPGSTENLYLVIFQDSAPITAIEKLLRRTHATITGGPGKNGIFTLKILANNQAARKKAVRNLSNSSLVVFFERQTN